LSKEADDRIPTALVLANRLKAMEYGLGTGTIVDATAASEESEPSQNDLPTRVSTVKDRPATEISPTAIDPDSDVARDEPYSWNNATVVTSESDPGSGQQQVPWRADTVVDQRATNMSRFTTIEEDRQQRKSAASPKWTKHLPTVGLALALVAFVVGIFIAIQPPSAEKLLTRIGRLASQDKIKDARADIDLFLELYPLHEKASSVRDWQQDVDCEFLFSRLRNRAKRETLTEVQAAFVQAMKALERRPKTAHDLFRELLDEHGKDSDVPNPITCGEAAKHQLKRLADILPAEEVASSETGE